MTDYLVLQPIDSDKQGLLPPGAVYVADLAPETEAALISAGILAAPKSVAAKEKGK